MLWLCLGSTTARAWPKSKPTMVVLGKHHSQGLTNIKANNGRALILKRWSRSAWNGLVLWCWTAMAGCASQAQRLFALICIRPMGCAWPWHLCLWAILGNTKLCFDFDPVKPLCLKWDCALMLDCCGWVCSPSIPTVCFDFDQAMGHGPWLLCFWAMLGNTKLCFDTDPVKPLCLKRVCALMLDRCGWVCFPSTTTVFALIFHQVMAHGCCVLLSNTLHHHIVLWFWNGEAALLEMGWCFDVGLLWLRVLPKHNNCLLWFSSGHGQCMAMAVVPDWAILGNTELWFASMCVFACNML